MKNEQILFVPRDFMRGGVRFLATCGLMLCTSTVWAEGLSAQECVADPVLNLLKLITILTVISVVFEYVLAERAFGRLPRFRATSVVIGKRLVPWFAAILITMQLVPLLTSCFTLL